jgi:NADPH-dependent F420 reductase
MARIAVLGGTGPEGLGLALRFALAGEEIVIGSRDRARAEAAARQKQQRLRESCPQAQISGCENAVAIEGADMVVVCVPFAAMESLLRELAPKLAGTIVLDVVNPLVLEHGSFHVQPPPAGSAGELAQLLLPEAFVVSAFKNLSAEELRQLEHPLHGDVIVCSDHDEPRSRVMELIRRVPELRAVDAGPLVNARHLESITALLLNLNRRHQAITSIEILGLKR